MSEEAATATTDQPPKEEQSRTEEPSATPARLPDDGTPLVLVTGASGYIASHVIKNLLEDGTYRVRGTVRDATNESKTKPIRDIVPNATKPLELVSADLTSEGAWEEAVKGCTYVLHLASPFPATKPKDEDIVIRPAVEGTLNVLKACAAEKERNGPLKRVVLMSSIAAVSNGLGGDSSKIHTEEDWSDEPTLPPYEKSKYRAERAGWDYMEKLEENKKFEFSVVNPAAVLGPVLNSAAGNSTSVGFVSGILGNKMPGIPNVNFPMIDVRDVAKGTIAAMEKPEAANRRYLLANENPVPFSEIAAMIAEEFVPQGYKVPTKPMNRALMWIFALFDSTAKTIRSIEGKSMKYNISRMTGELGVTPHSSKATVLDTCYSIIDCGIINKTPQYLGHPDNRPPPQEKLTEEPKAEEKPAEEPKAEEKPTEEPKAEEKPAEEPKAEEKPAEEPKAEEKLAEEPKAKEKPVEEPKAEEKPAEEPKAEEKPAEEPKAEEKPAEEPKAEEKPAEEPKAEEKPAEEPKAEEKPAEEPKAEEKPVEEPKAEETPAEEPKAEEKPVEEPKAEEKPVEEPKAEEKPAEELEKPVEEPKAEETPVEEQS